MRIIEDFRIDLDNKEIIRLLQSKNSSKKSRMVPSSLLEDIEKLKVEALRLIHPKAAFDIFESKILNPRFLFSKSEFTVLAICTIGKELESLSKLYLREGNLANGVILDAIASHAAEQTAEYVNNKILEELKSQILGKEITCRFSPGYCQWELEKGQKTIFGLLDGGKLGITLTSSSMMNPVKSVSFAINIGDEVDKELGIRDCENCDMMNCAYRRI